MSQPQTEKQRQSRIGKQPVPVPKGVTFDITSSSVTVKGPKGELSFPYDAETVTVKQHGDKVEITAKDGTAKRGAMVQGLVRSLLKNAAIGVSAGFKASLDFYGVGYRAELKGTDLHLALGLSHPVKYALPKGIIARVETIDEGGTKRPRLHLESHDRDLLGKVGSRIKAYRPPEPYKGKGIRYTGEKIREKAGKTGAK
jgi:large subunit ribosomal protein L6